MAVQRSFNSGEFSPEMFGRTDLEKYPNAVKSMFNMIPLPHGPAIRRPGLEFISNARWVETTDGRNHTKLMPFIYSTGQTYMIEFITGESTIGGFASVRPFFKGGTIDDPGSPGDELIIETTYQEWNLKDVRAAFDAIPDDSAQSADVMFLAYKYFPPHKLARVAHDEWTYDIATFTDEPEAWDGTYIEDGTTYRSWPSCLCFSNERLFWSGLPGNAQTIWGSKVGVYTDHGVSDPLVADDALELILSDKQANPIKWLSSSSKLAVGTTGSESWITSDTGSGQVTATSKLLIPSGSDGSGDVKPVAVGNTIIFVDEHGKTVRELKYDYSTDSLKGDDLILLAEHLTRHDPIVRIALQKRPYRLIWAVTESGKLLSGTYYPEHTIIAWAQHETDGKFLDIASMPGDGQDEVWFIVQRIKKDDDGCSEITRNIERLGSFFDEETTEHDMLDGYKIAPYLTDSSLMLDNRLEVEYVTATNPIYIKTKNDHSLTVGDRIKFRGIFAQDTDEQLLDRLTLAVSYIHPDDGYFTLEDDDKNDINSMALEDLTLGCGVWPLAYAYHSDYSQGKMDIAPVVTTVSGLDHLEGLDVDVNADGIIETHTVSGGSITLDAEASVILAGLPYSSIIEPFHPIEQGPNAQEFNPMQTSRITGIIAQVNKSVGFSIGVTGSGTDLFENVTPSTPAGQAEALYTGYTKRVEPRCGNGYNQNVVISQDQALPLTVIAIHTEIERGD